ncbi:putative UDP-glucuronate:xylan alpha-glucuronosyltransferase 4 [Senna tora]|uniref:Hexosyltransferase n=1 Tax=Senna tora TaxID=362788 RepID=A0A834WC47_9FABA|nr:putative UDP-glucuronate:xylan alpha-glucuronosyltransferase 4 [Senna tora]
MDKRVDHLPPHVETVPINFDHVDENLKWEDFFPEWIDEDQKWGPPKCPRMPLPSPENFQDLNVVVARLPCGHKKEGIRDLFRLQVNLVVANLAVGSGLVSFDSYRTVFVVFIGSCGPMVEIFRCDDLLTQRGEYWVYKPKLKWLKQVTLMPVSSCQIAPSFAETGKELWRPYMSQSTLMKKNLSTGVPKVAYVTVLHSSEAYVCGAIALAQSILRTHKYSLNPNTQLLLLADKSIGPKSIRGLKAAGWKIKRIQRILSPFAKKDSYNRWNYSKLRIWQLTNYDKVIFLDSDLLVLNNIYHFSIYPQLSAAPNDLSLFNSGFMIIEPSLCMFEHLMQKTFRVESYNGGDQGFLNEIFTWWHRLPSRLNYLKINNQQKELTANDVYAIHYLGLKPWMCYKDYDCNWDMKDHQIFASDSAHRRWWEVYEEMPKELQAYCGLTKKMEDRLVKWRGRAANATLADAHWKIEVKDSRREHYVEEDK